MLLAVPVLIGLLWAAPRWLERLPWLLSFSLALPASAVVKASGQSVGAFQVYSLMVMATAGWLWARREIRPPFGWPGGLALAVFVVWGCFVTVAGPSIFSGVLVLSSDGGIDEQVAAPSELAFTLSNLAQAFYLIATALVICFIATRPRISVHLLTPGLTAAMLLSNWRLGYDRLGLPYPVAIIDSGAFKYIDSTADGSYRLRGVFPEPSALALYSLAAVALSLAMLPRTNGWPRVAYLALAGSAALNLSYAGSGTALAGGGLAVALAVAIAIIRAVQGKTPVMPLAILGCAGMTAFLIFNARVLDFVSSQVGDKVDTTSYAARTTADIFSLELGIRVYGMGVGLGSNRPSSLWPMLFSCTGVIGLIAFAVLVVMLLRRAAAYPPARPIFWVLLTMLVTKSVSGSSISDPLLQLTLAMAAWASYELLLSDRGGGRHQRSDRTPAPARPAPELLGASPPGKHL